MRNQTLDRETLDDIIRRVVEVAQPEKIILFGASARSEMGPIATSNCWSSRQKMTRAGLWRGSTENHVGCGSLSTRSRCG